MVRRATLSSSYAEKEYQNGADLFVKRCISCHSISSSDSTPAAQPTRARRGSVLVGPPLSDLHEYYEKDIKKIRSIEPNDIEVTIHWNRKKLHQHLQNNSELPGNSCQPTKLGQLSEDQRDELITFIKHGFPSDKFKPRPETFTTVQPGIEGVKEPKKSIWSSFKF